VDCVDCKRGEFAFGLAFTFAFEFGLAPAPPAAEPNVAGFCSVAVDCNSCVDLGRSLAGRNRGLSIGGRGAVSELFAVTAASGGFKSLAGRIQCTPNCGLEVAVNGFFVGDAVVGVTELEVEEEAGDCGLTLVVLSTVGA